MLSIALAFFLLSSLIISSYNLTVASTDHSGMSGGGEGGEYDDDGDDEGQQQQTDDTVLMTFIIDVVNDDGGTAEPEDFGNEITCGNNEPVEFYGDAEIECQGHINWNHLNTPAGYALPGGDEVDCDSESGGIRDTTCVITYDDLPTQPAQAQPEPQPAQAQPPWTLYSNWFSGFTLSNIPE